MQQCLWYQVSQTTFPYAPSAKQYRDNSLSVGIPGKSFYVAEPVAVGVRRIGLATSIYRAAIGLMVAAVHEVRYQDTLEFVETGLPTPRLGSYMD